MPVPKKPWNPSKDLTFGQVYFFIKQKRFSINPFDKESIEEGKYLILKEARDVSPTYLVFMKAATMATGFSERTIKKILHQTKGK
mgnify:CR=1 FL=1|jgi:hypothetical protein